MTKILKNIRKGKKGRFQTTVGILSLISTMVVIGLLNGIAIQQEDTEPQEIKEYQDCDIIFMEFFPPPTTIKSFPMTLIRGSALDPRFNQ